MSNTDLTKNRGWTQLLATEQILPLIKSPLCYSY